jgi:hypothetical protein
MATLVNVKPPKNWRENQIPRIVIPLSTLNFAPHSIDSFPIATSRPPTKNNCKPSMASSVARWAMVRVHGMALHCNYLARALHRSENSRGTAIVLPPQESPPSSNNSLFLLPSEQESSGNRFNGMRNMEKTFLPSICCNCIHSVPTVVVLMSWSVVSNSIHRVVLFSVFLLPLPAHACVITHSHFPRS